MSRCLSQCFAVVLRSALKPHVLTQACARTEALYSALKRRSLAHKFKVDEVCLDGWMDGWVNKWQSHLILPPFHFQKAFLNNSKSKRHDNRDHVRVSFIYGVNFKPPSPALVVISRRAVSVESPVSPDWQPSSSSNSEREHQASAAGLVSSRSA